MTGQQLKNSILQMAIQGKLVPQDPNDEPASVLLERIREEKEALIKAGKIRREKNPSVIFRGEDNLPYEKVGRKEPMCIADDVPFNIPSSWSWTRIETISIPIGGKKNQIQAKEILPMGEIPVVSQGKDLIDGFCNDEEKKIDTLPLIMFGDHTRNVKYIDFEFVIGADGTKFHKVLECNPKYIYYWMIYAAETLRNRGYARHYGLLKACYIPLPPLKEQERIVSKIGGLRPFIEHFEVVEGKRALLDSSLPEQLRKSILQESVQGKLVSQDVNDEPASVLLEKIRIEKKQLIKPSKLKQDRNDSVIFRRDNSYYEKVGGIECCIDDEIPFDIPDSWAWSRLGSILQKLTDGTHTTPKYVTSGVPFISVKDISSGKISFANTKFITEDEHRVLSSRCDPHQDDILLTKVGTTGIPVLVETDKEFSIFVSVAQLRFSTINLDKFFMVYLLQSPLVQEQCAENTRGVGNKNWVMRDIANTLLCIPPRAEQTRIVQSLDIILPLLS